MAERLKVVIVDDDATTLRVLGGTLSARGYRVTERDTAVGSTLAIIREKPDVVLLDVRMPGLDGDKLVALIMQGVVPPPVVILHSSVPLPDLERLARTVGASGAIQKVGDMEAFALDFDRIVAATRRMPGRHRL